MNKKHLFLLGLALPKMLAGAASGVRLDQQKMHEKINAWQQTKRKIFSSPLTDFVHPGAWGRIGGPKELHRLVSSETVKQGELSTPEPHFYSKNGVASHLKLTRPDTIHVADHRWYGIYIYKAQERV